MAQMKVFVSHSHADNSFCQDLVQGLTSAGADVWYDSDSMHSGQLGPVIERELRTRPVFIVVLSPQALNSRWVEEETRWAYNRLRRDPGRIMLPVLAAPLRDEDDIWLFLQDFRRVGATGTEPFPPTEAVSQTLHALQLMAPNEAPLPVAPRSDENAADLLTRAKALYLVERTPEALPLLRRATELDPSSADAWAILSETLSGLGQPVEGLLASERAVSLDTRLVEGWYARSLGLIRLHYYKEALDASAQAIALDPDSWRALDIHARALAYLQRYDEALAASEAALRLDADNPTLWNNKGALFNIVHRYQEAFDAAEHAMALLGETPSQWDTKGEALLGLGNYELALLCLNRSLTLDPNSPDSVETWEKKAKALRALGRDQEAEEAERQAQKLAR
jgi:tetratricopeptide (TPR) repeat protein